ncbi:MAG: hypothetical protein GKS05_08145 [Nitrospirales bacterium]|nr:hypothetical protein [Nitrospirales bacterium]
MHVDIRWLWVAMVGGSILLALPGNSAVAGIIRDVFGHFFSTLILAVIPIVGYRILYKQIDEKIITYFFAAAWAFLVLSQFVRS